MTFGTIETSRYKGRPTNLFYVRYGEAPNSYFAYTDAENPILHEGVTYTPLTIMRGKINVTGTMDKQAMEVRCSLNVPMAELFRVYPPSRVVNLIIRQGHLSDPDSQFLVAWTGRIVSAKRVENELVMTCEPVSTSMKRIGLRRHYQYSCPHVLYGEWCRANKAAATRSVVVSAINSLEVTLEPGWDSEERQPKYLGGLVEWTNSANDRESRTILRVLDNRRLLLSGYLRDLNAGDTVNVVLGCNHACYFNEDRSLNEETDCHFLHNNIHNFGGCPFIPKKNPVGMLNQYY